MTEPTTSVAELSDVRDAIDTYRTGELATMSRGGVPITWPIVCAPAPGGDRIVITTSISFPQKAFNIRRDPRVALLFSDPTGTGRTDLPQILVRGTAVCPPLIHTGTDGLEDYWRRLAQRQPGSTGYVGGAIGRRLFDWYYMRLVITVTPREVTIGRPADLAPMAAPRPGRSDRTAFAQVCRELPGFSSVVLGTAAEGDAPVLRRVRLRASVAAERFVIDGPDDAVREGPASLLMHRHDALLSNQRQIGVIGRLTRTGNEPVFTADRLLPNQFPTNPVALLQVVRHARRAADRYLERRGLDRPTIDWAAHRAAAPAADS